MEHKILSTVLRTIRQEPKAVFVGIFSQAKYALIKYGYIVINPDLSCELTAEGMAALGE